MRMEGRKTREAVRRNEEVLKGRKMKEVKTEGETGERMA